jgi:amino acid transporter
MVKETFSRTIGKIGIVVIALNGIIGAGIFALPSGAAELSGNFSPWMFVLCGLLMATVILSFAQLSCGFSQNGGPVVYAQQAFGNHLSFQKTWLLYIGRLTALAANSNALVFYLALFIPEVSSGLYHYVALSSVIILLTVLNLFGTKRAMNALNLLTFFKLLPLFAFILVGFFTIDPSKVFEFDLAQVSDFDGALLLLVYAFIGFEGAVVPAGESKDPNRNIAKALLITLFFTVLMYFLIQSISLSVLDNLAQTTTPVADASAVVFGDYGVVLITFAAIISIGGNLFSTIFAAPRMLQALALTKSLPSWFAQLSPRHNSPTNSIIFFCCFALILALTGSFIWLAVISTLARLLGYFISILALIKLQKNLKREQKWFLPFGLLIPVLGLLICVWLSMQANAVSWGMTSLFILLGSVLFFLRNKVK